MFAYPILALFCPLRILGGGFQEFPHGRYSVVCLAEVSSERTWGAEHAQK